MSKKWLAAPLAIALGTTGILTGCSGSSGSSTAATTTAAAQSNKEGVTTAATDSTTSGNENSGESIKVSFMTWESDTMNQAILDTFTDAIPGVTVELVPSPLQDYGIKLQEMLASDIAPDIFMVGNDMALNYHAEDLVLNLKPYMDADTSFTEGFYPGTLSTFTTSDGQMAGLPGLINLYGYFYNKKYFDDAGLAYPTEDWTFDDLYATAEKLKDESSNRFGLYQKTNDVFTIAIYSASKDGNGFCDNIYPVSKVQATESFLEGTQKAADAIASKAMTDPTFDDANLVSMFMQGAVPIMRYGQWAADELIRNAPDDLNWGYISTPKVEKNAQILDSVGWSINKKAANPDQAFAVLKYLESETYKVVLAKTPVAPPAYQPAADGYYQTLKDKGHEDLAQGLDYMLNAEIKLPVRFLDSWSAKASKYLDADWNSFLTGEKPVSDIQTVIVDPINDVINSSK
ncbi:extracellular solute-binding protein [Oscillospiraceae bacterium HV4-5-C5C]|nr:extracellular solute-binding protein [Oscillospiraceae bacterium HV4-5-C5C]